MSDLQGLNHFRLMLQLITYNAQEQCPSVEVIASCPSLSVV